MQNFPKDAGSATGNLAPVALAALVLPVGLCPETPACVRLVDDILLQLQLLYNLSQFYETTANFKKYFNVQQTNTERMLSILIISGFNKSDFYAATRNCNE